jgi:Growth-arrest specific micro-tubule binding
MLCDLLLLLTDTVLLHYALTSYTLYQLGELRDAYAELEVQFAEAEAERDELYDSFEGAVRGVQQRADFRNLILERKVSCNILTIEAVVSSSNSSDTASNAFAVRIVYSDYSLLAALVAAAAKFM